MKNGDVRTAVKMLEEASEISKATTKDYTEMPGVNPYQKNLRGEYLL